MSSTRIQPLPKSWGSCPISTVVEPEVAQTGPHGESFTYVDISSIDNGSKRIVEPKHLPTKEAPSRARQVLRAGDVLVSMTRPNLNAVALVSGELAGSIGSTGFNVLRARSVEPRWLYYYVQTSEFVESMSSLVQGALYPAVRPKDIRGHVLPVAPLAEQRRIVAELEKQLTRLDAGVAALKRVQAQLKRYRASVLKAACEGRLVPTEAELARREKRDYEPADKLLERILKERRARWENEQLAKMKAAGRTPRDDKWKSKYVEPAAPDVSGLPALPEGWVWARAEQLCDFITKGTTPPPEKLRTEGPVPFVKVYNLSPKGFLDFTVAPTFVDDSVHRVDLARSRLFPGDVLMNIVGPPLGKVAEVPSSFPEWNMNQAIAVFRAMPSLDRRFLSICLRTESVLSWAISRTKTTAGQVNLTLEVCRDLPIPLPPQSEQQRIAAEVGRHLSICEFASTSLQANSERSARLRQSILKAAFSGSLVPQNPHDEPAPKLLERLRHAASSVPTPTPSKSARPNKTKAKRASA